jgi:hypothetical protein
MWQDDIVAWIHAFGLRSLRSVGIAPAWKPGETQRDLLVSLFGYFGR